MNFKKNRIFLVFLFIILNSCKEEFKQCTFNFDNQNQNLYNEVLTELVEKRLFNFYLGENWEKVNDLYIPFEEPDTAKIKKLVIKFQNEIYKDTTKFCEIYLDTLLPRNFRNWNDYSENKDYLILFKDFKGYEQAVLDSLNSGQKEYSGADFQLCTSKVNSIEDFEGFENYNYKGGCLIGKIAFSKVYFNSQKNKAILYYEFKCGEDMCGMGEIIEIQKINERWKITEYFMKWVS